MRSGRAHVVWVMLASLAMALPCAREGVAEAALEYRVKAAFLYNFAKFVTWPSAAFPNPAAPIVFCVAGEDPFGDGCKEPLVGGVVGFPGHGGLGPVDVFAGLEFFVGRHGRHVARSASKPASEYPF